MKVVVLKEICHKWHIKSGGKKADTIGNILSHVSTAHQEFGAVQKMERVLESTKLKDPAPLHDFYLLHFNWLIWQIRNLPVLRSITINSSGSLSF